MKKILNLQVLFALLVAAAPLAATAQITTYFTDNFSNGSTTNGPSIRGGSPTASYTSYDIASTKNTIPGTNGTTILGPNDFKLALAASTSSGFLEAQALFVTNAPGGTNAIALSQPGDYIDIAVTFTNTSGLLAGTTSTLWLGLYNSGGAYPSNAPCPGWMAQSGLNTTAGSTNALGNCANWQGYYAQMENGGSASRITSRPIQTAPAGTTSANQELLGSNVGGGAFNNPVGTTIETAPGSPSFTFTTGGQYTMELRITVNAANSLMISNSIYDNSTGPGTNGTKIFTQGSATGITNATYLTSAFDGFAIGALNKVAGNVPTLDISLISITGTNTVISGPPTITLQPVPVTVATNGACAFFLNAVGFNVAYQWWRNGASLADGGDISGSKTSTLVVSPAGTSDVFSGANGYYCVVSGAGGFSTNSVTNSLALVPATNLFWKTFTGTWDLNTTANWQDTNGTPQVFNFGDSVTFSNVAGSGGGTITLTGPYLSAGSVTVNSTLGLPYVFAGNGSIAGPGNLIYTGTKFLTINNANTYTGGTIISNASARLNLGNYAGLGSGPVTLALAGGKIGVAVVGNASSGISGDVVLNDDFTIQFDPAGAFAGVFLKNLTGTAGKTLTLLPNSVYTYGNTITNSRVRVYGNNMTNNANLALDPDPSHGGNEYDGPFALTFAPYNTGGFQIYNGVISGSGAFMQKGDLAYLNGPNTYSSGTFIVNGVGPLGLGSDSDTTPTYGPIGTGPLYLSIDSNTALTGSGQIFAAGGSRTIWNPIQYPSGTNNLTLIIGGANNFTFDGPFTLNGNDQITTNTINTRFIQITNTGVTTLAGVISDWTNGDSGPVSAAYGLTITGNGTNASGPLVLTTTETYTGPTTVSNGATLQVNGALDTASLVVVGTNATLSGSGTINGPVIINAGGALAPGAASIGAISLNSGLTNSGNIKVRVNRSGSISDNAVVNGALTNNGTGSVLVSNLGSTLQVNDIFFLFNKAMSNSAAMPVIGGGVAWSNKLAINGSIQVISPPDVSVQGSAPASAGLGLNFTNTITVTNAGPGPAYSIIVTDALPANVKFVSANAGGTTNANAGQVVWNIFALPANTASNLTLAMNASALGNATNIATVASSADANTANNSVTNVTAVVPLADTGVQLSGPGSASVGANYNYTLTVTNIGAGLASAVVVTDLMPANVTFVSADKGGTTNSTANPKVVVWSGFDLAAVTGTNFTLTVNAATSGSATNLAGVVSSSVDTNSVNNTATNIMTIVAQADTGVQLSGPASVALGSAINCTLTLTNIGPGLASAMVVTDSMPANVTFVSANNGGTTNGHASQVVWSGFALAATTGTNFTLTLNAAAGGNATNTATVASSATDPNTANNSATNVTLITTVIIPGVSASIGTITMDGLNVVISGTNGVNGGTYYLLDSTNAATPLNLWLSVATNVVSTNGAANNPFTFTGTNVVDPNGAQQFYILSNTNNH